LCQLEPIDDPNLIVGFDSSDDAAVYKISDEESIIQTVDLFPPIVDNPETYGAIAAANALSDVYAMGGTPKLALNILCIPADMDKELVSGILHGGNQKVNEAGAVICGGHTIKDNEPKYGLSVTGFIKTSEVVTNSGARPGDVLILTKPIGTGILSTAMKSALLGDESYNAMAASMMSLNGTSSRIMKQFAASGCTDITGFGLAGHAYEMAKGSGTSIIINSRKVPILPQAEELASYGILPSGTHSNRRWLCGNVDFSDEVSLTTQDLMFDPQTSGGLLFTVKESLADSCLRALITNGVQAAEIGYVDESQTSAVKII